MTYPQQYPAQMPQFPQQNPYPPAPVQPMPYPPQSVPGYLPSPAAPSVPLAQGSLSSFYGQPSAAGGPSWSWQNKPLGHSYAGIVARTITSSDVQQVTSPQGQPQTFRDGRPKFQMAVPMQVQPSPDFPQGEATWFVQGRTRDELVRAMTEAGCPAEVINAGPEKGAGIIVTLVERRAGRAGFNPSNIVQVRYQRPANATSGAPPVPEQPAQQIPAQQAPQPAYAGPVPPVQPAPQQMPVAPQGPAQPQQAPPAPPPLAADAIAALEALTSQPYTGPRA